MEEKALEGVYLKRRLVIDDKVRIMINLIIEIKKLRYTPILDRNNMSSCLDKNAQSGVRTRDLLRVSKT